MNSLVNQIAIRINMAAQNALFCHEIDDNEGVLKWLFMIEFYKDLLEA